MDTKVKNLKIGIATIVTCYLAFIFYLLTLFLTIEIFGKNNMVYSYVLVGFLVAFILAAGVIFLISLILNINQTKADHKISRGLRLTLISIPPIMLCFLAFAVKAMTEGH